MGPNWGGYSKARPKRVVCVVSLTSKLNLVTIVATAVGIVIAVNTPRIFARFLDRYVGVIITFGSDSSWDPSMILPNLLKKYLINL